VTIGEEGLKEISKLYPELKVLKLSNNQIKGPLEEVIAGLEGCAKLESLDLSKNPCVGEDNEAYVKAVREKLKTLEVLDGFNKEG